MSLSISLTGHVQAEDEAKAAGVEQQMSDELVAFVKKYAEWIDYGEATFQFAENLDLTAIAADHVANPPDTTGDQVDPQSPGIGDPPPPSTAPTPPPAGNETGTVGDPPPDAPVIDEIPPPTIEVPPEGSGAFVTKLAGEDFAAYQTRLWNYNESVPVPQQAPSLSEEEWTARSVG